MTRDEAKQLLPIIKAWAERKTIQVKYDRDGEWEDHNGTFISFNFAPSAYRIKPEPSCRPFKNPEECWQEMQKHQPFGWVKKKNRGDYFHIRHISEDLDGKRHVSFSIDRIRYYGEELFDEFVFADGSPFGMSEDKL